MGDITKRQSQKTLQVSKTSSGIRTSPDAFALPWGRLCAAYPRSENTTLTVAVYHERLRKFDPDSLLAAVNLAIDRCKFFPTVAELIEIIASLQQPARIDEPRPNKEEARAVLAALHESIQRFESADMKNAETKIAARKAELRAQAVRLGVRK